ncbi:MAG: glycosyltransferase family 2 protein [Thermomicrobiales bacterium]
MQPPQRQPAANQPGVSVIVLTWNQRDITLECLTSLFAQHYPALHIILVDNGSEDGTAAAVRARFPAVQVIENGANLGFAAGNNAGLQYALAGDDEFVMLLNNDTIVDPHMIERLLAPMRADPAIGITGPKMLYFDQPDVIWCAGNRIDWRTGESVRLQADERDDSADDTPRDVDFITACGICFRRAVLDQIGLLDSRFFIYYEETDWCTRARHAGWRICYTPSARLLHKVSATMGTTSPATEYYMTRNVLLFLAKSQGGLTRVRSLAGALFGNCRTIAAYTLKSRYRPRRPNRDARLFALRDALLGRWGKMGADVAALCYPRRG